MSKEKRVLSLLRSKLGLALRIGISLVLIGWIVSLVDSAQLATALSGSNLLYVVLMIVVANVDRFLMSYKWNLLLAAKGIRLPLMNAVSAYYKSTFLGSLFLPTVGADAVRIYEVSQQTKRVEDIISSVVIERIIGIVAVCIVGVLSLGLFILNVGSTGWDALVGLLFLVSFAIVIFTFSMRYRGLTLLRKRLAGSKWRSVRKLETVLESYQDYSKHQRVLMVFLLLTIAEQLFSVMNAFLMAQALHLTVPFWVFVMFVPIIMMVIRLPISFQGFGMREGLYVYLFGLVGVPQAEAFLIGFLAAIVARIATAPLTLYFFLSNRAAPQPPEVGAQKLALEE